MSDFKNILSKSVTPILYINLGGMILGALWLLIVYQWHVLLPAFFALFFSQYIIPISLIPAGICSHLMGFYQKNKQFKKEKLMFILTISYMLIFITIWVSVIFEFITSGVNHNFLFPALVFAVSSAMAPLFLWVKRDKNNIFVLVIVQSMQLAILVLFIIKLFIIKTGLIMSASILLPIVTLAVVFEWFSEEKKKK